MVAKLYGNDPVLKAIHKSMVGNNNTVVTDWYSTLIKGSDLNKLCMKTVDGWCILIRQKFGKTTMERMRNLDAIRFSWDESINGFVTQNVRACIKSRIFNPAAQVFQIFKRLPYKFTLGMNPDVFDDVEKLELDLQGCKPAARAAHRATYKRTTNASPERERGDKRKVSPPSRPCNLCGKMHWRTGPNATPCPPGKVVSIKKEVYQTSEEEDLDGSSGSSDHPVLVSDDETEYTEDQSFHDAESYIVDWENHGKLIDYDS